MRRIELIKSRDYSDNNQAPADIAWLLERNAELLKVVKAASPLANDRAAGGRMLTTITEAKHIQELIKAAIAEMER